MAISPQMIMAGGEIASALGGLFGGSGKGQNAANQFQWNRQWQMEQMQNRLQWAAEDAKKAGFHPLVGAGGNFSPSSAGMSVGDSGPSTADRIGNLGQNISRAASAYQTKEERALSTILNRETVRKAGLENELLASQIARIKQSPTVGFPSDDSRNVVSGQSGSFRINPAEITSMDPSNRGVSAGRGLNPGTVEYNTYGGGTMLGYDQNLSESVESNIIKQVEAFLRNDVPYYVEKLNKHAARQRQKVSDFNSRYNPW